MKTVKYLLLFLFISTNASAQTDVSGHITTNTNWTLVGSPYRVTGDVYVDNGITLTVDPDVIVRFNSNRYMYVYGMLIANSATFTSHRDSTGGTPSPNDWKSIYINNGGNVNFTGCSVAYGNPNIYVYNGTLTFTGGTVKNSYNKNVQLRNGIVNIGNSSLYFDNPTSNRYNFYSDGGSSTVDINRTEIYNAQYNVFLSNTGTVIIDSSYIYNTSTISSSINLDTRSDSVHVSNTDIYESTTNIYAYGGDLTLKNTNVYNGTKYGTGLHIYSPYSEIIFYGDNNFYSLEKPIVYQAAGNIIYHNTNTISNNTYNAVFIDFSGGSSGYTMVLDTVEVPYYFTRNFTIPSGSTLEIASNNIVKFAQYTGIFVNGAFIAEAGVADKIYFTAFSDDNLGGDTNNDGAGTIPASNYWYGISFNSASADSACVIRRCEIKFAGYNSYYYGGAISIFDASPTIDDNSVSNSYYGMRIEGASDPVISNNVIGVSDLVPVAMSIFSNPVFINNSFSNEDNEYDAIGLLGGTLTRNGHLIKRSFTDVPNVTYLLLGTITVPEGLDLTIDKGIVIKGYQSSHKLVIGGKLTADATADSMIVFTSAKDDNFGNPQDTNKDGTSTDPAKGNWGGITFNSTADSTSILDYCKLRYGHNTDYHPGSGNPYWGGQITIINCHPQISNCDISDVDYGIVSAISAKPRIWNNAISNTTYTPIAMSVSSDPDFSGNTFTNAGYTALGLLGENIGVDGVVKNRNVAGYTNITYVLHGTITVNSGANLSFEPGIVVKIAQYQSFFVDGGFKAQGTFPDGQIIFTSLEDDNVGNPGDTNGDGNATSPDKGDWSSIVFRGTSDDEYSLIDYCEIKYSGNWYYSYYYGAVVYVNAGSKIQNSTISNSYYGLVYDGTSTAVAENVVIQNCYWDPIAMSLKSDPTFTNITFTANGSKGIRILEGTLSSDAYLKKRDVAGIYNIGYILDNLTINTNAVLTFEPGVVIKFNDNRYITVNGALIANGTKDENIVFTSIRDDSRGGDTNNDGNTSTPAKGNWRAIIFKDTSIDSLNVLKNVDIRFGGNYSGQNRGIISVENSKTVIDSCDISHSSSAGIGVYGSAYPVISNNNISNIDYTPISMSMFSNPVFINNTASNIGIMALGIIPETYATTAAIPIRNFAGFNNITYYYYGTATINSGTTITIPAGMVFKHARFDVNGAVKINGTPAEKVVFTELRDDEYGNPLDTNGDGSLSSPYIDYYYNYDYRILFNDVSNDTLSSVYNAVFRYVDRPVVLSSASPTIRNSVFDKNNWGIILDGVSYPVVKNCSFDNLTYAPFKSSILSYPDSTAGNSMSGSTYRALGIKGETLVSDYTITKRNFAGITNIPYFISEDYTIGSGVILSIEPGIVLKFYRNVGINVRGALKAIAGASLDSIIVFTHIYDDFYGGDTNADSAQTVPSLSSSYGRWDGISFADESEDNNCILQNVIIRFAWNGAIITNSASPAISYSAIKDNRYALVANGASDPSINYCDIYDNQYYSTDVAVQNNGGAFTIDAENNWWGSNTGPTHTSNPGGTGQSVSNMVDFIPFLSNGTHNPIAGDVSLNGKIQAFDASKILKHVVNPAGPDALNDIQKRVADVSNEMGITAYDASLILQHVVGSISVFPSELQKIQANPNALKSLQKIIASQKVKSGRIIISDSKTNGGETIDVPVKIENVNGMTSALLILKYEQSYVNIASVKDVDMAENGIFAFYDDKEKGEITIALAGSEMIPSGGNILLLSFNVSEDIRDDVTSPLIIKKFLANETDLTKFAKSGSIQITGMPVSFALSQNYPNPFNPFTTIEYRIPNDDVNVNISIYNSIGQLVKTLVNETKNAGKYEVVWDGTDSSGLRVSTGVYIYRMRAGDTFKQTKKLLLIK
ncbi:hypothetical protein AMJ80_06240 [bacterium SM23_31]|nr:MAG: hypothetical protein AMJ80_06240 [bacterium SM23_31]